MSRRNAAEVKNDCTSVWKALMRVAVSNAKSSALVLNSRGPLVTAKLWRCMRTLVLQFRSARAERVERCTGRRTIHIYSYGRFFHLSSFVQKFLNLVII